MQSLLCLLLLCVLSISQSRFSVESGWLAGVYSNVCSQSMDGVISEHFTSFNPNKIPQTNHSDREVIVSPMNSHAVPFGVNLAVSLMNLPNLTAGAGSVELIFVVYDELTLDICDDMYLPCWIPRNILSVQNHTVVNTFHHRRLVIPEVISRLLSVGAHVLFTDTDSVWLRSPFRLLHSGKNTPGTIQVGPARISLLPPPPLTVFGQMSSSSGIRDMSFFHVSSGPATVNFFMKLYEQCARQRMSWASCFELQLSLHPGLGGYVATPPALCRTV